MGRIRLTLNSADETRSFGVRLAKEISPPLVLALTGDLGAGKTTFVQGLGQGLGIQEPMQSPTFVILNAYNDLLFHFDLYRLNLKDFVNLGFEEYFQKGICAIEWPERITQLLPPTTLWIHFSYEGLGRIVEVK